MQIKSFKNFFALDPRSFLDSEQQSNYGNFQVCRQNGNARIAGTHIHNHLS